jgi:hypothetical protein
MLIMFWPNGSVTCLSNEPPNPCHINKLSPQELTDIFVSNEFTQEALFGQWRYTYLETPGLLRCMGFKSQLNAAYLLASNLKRYKAVFKIPRRLRVPEQFSSLMGQANYVPLERITSPLADS